MSWVKLDPKRAINHKLLTAGMAANGLDIVAMCWTTLQEDDGFISAKDVEMLAGMYRCEDWQDLVDTLVAVDRWTKDGRRKGYVIRGYLEFNFSKADMEARRKRDRDRKRAHMRGDSDSAGNPGGNGAES